jgi:hypothetical protein
MTPEQDKQIVAQLDELSGQFIQRLKALQADNSVIGVIVPLSYGLEVRVRVNGNSQMMVNLIGALAQQLIPEDFMTLLAELQTHPAFELQRKVPDATRKMTVN